MKKLIILIVFFMFLTSFAWAGTIAQDNGDTAWNGVSPTDGQSLILGGWINTSSASSTGNYSNTKPSDGILGLKLDWRDTASFKHYINTTANVYYNYSLSIMFYDEGGVDQRDGSDICLQSDNTKRLCISTIEPANPITNKYVYYTDGAWVQSTMARTIGWHQAVIYWNANNTVSFSINGTEIGYDSTPTVDKGTNEVMLLDNGYTGVQTKYYDEVIVYTENFVILNFEYPTPPSGTINNTQVNINVSCSGGGNVSLWFDDNTQPINLVLDNKTSPANWTTNVTSSGTYYYIASCDAGAHNSSIRTWSYDAQPPTITINQGNYWTALNTTVNSSSENLTLNITFEDNSDLFGYEINISKDGITKLNISNSSLTGNKTFNLTKSYSMFNWENGDYLVQITASDTHTAEEILKYEVMPKISRLDFKTTEGNEIIITSEQQSTPTYEKQYDRYNFGFRYSDKTPGTKSFILECDNTLTYLPNSKYQGHFICADGIKGNWIDFEGVSGKPTIEKIDNKKYRIIFNNLGDVEFKSIGGLNYAYSDYMFTLERYNIDNCSLFNYSLLNLSYYNQLTGSAIQADITYDLNFEYNGISQNVGGKFINAYNNSFCSHVNNVNMTVTGQLKLEKSDYGTQVYEITSTSPIYASTSPVTQKKLYLVELNETSTVVFTWLFSDYTPVLGTMLIYECVGDGTETLVQSVPITNGEASANLNLLDTIYKYIVISQGVTYSDSEDYSKCHIETQTTRSYIIEKTGSNVAPIIGIYSIDCNVTKTGENTVLRAWGTNPQSSEPITGCIFANRVSGLGSTLIYSNCTSSEYSIERTIPASGYSYSVYGKIYQGGYSIQCDKQIEFNFDKATSRTFGLSGILAIVFLIVGFVLLFSNETPEWYPIAGIGALLLAFVSGLLSFGWIPTSSLIGFIVIIIIVGRYHRQNT